MRFNLTLYSFTQNNESWVCLLSKKINLKKKQTNINRGLLKKITSVKENTHGKISENLRE